MKNISDIDSNFKIKTTIEREGLKFIDVLSSPFKIYGVYYEDGKFRRLPEKIAEKVNAGVLYTHAYTTGGRVRFRTDSPYVAIQMTTDKFATVSYQALSGSAGFDLYVDNKHFGTFMPPYSMKTGYESIIEFGSSKMREITINMPIYGEVHSLNIGLDENSSLLPPSDYISGSPIVFYGSSITHGGCASRPGNTYPAIISRRFNSDILNLGFSGSALAEDEIANYIAGLDMKIFVYDYDHNAPNPEHLEKTHERMFKIFREKHPETPVIMMTSPSILKNRAVADRRKEIIRTTYLNALNSGDKNVYYLDGEEVMAPCGLDGTVEGIHPNDIGFYFMAKAVGDLIEKIL